MTWSAGELGAALSRQKSTKIAPADPACGNVVLRHVRREGLLFVVRRRVGRAVVCQVRREGSLFREVQFLPWGRSSGPD